MRELRRPIEARAGFAGIARAVRTRRSTLSGQLTGGGTFPRCDGQPPNRRMAPRFASTVEGGGSQRPVWSSAVINVAEGPGSRPEAWLTLSPTSTPQTIGLPKQQRRTKECRRVGSHSRSQGRRTGMIVATSTVAVVAIAAATIAFELLVS